MLKYTRIPSPGFHWSRFSFIVWHMKTTYGCRAVLLRIYLFDDSCLCTWHSVWLSLVYTLWKASYEESTWQCVPSCDAALTSSSPKRLLKCTSYQLERHNNTSVAPLFQWKASYEVNTRQCVPSCAEAPTNSSLKRFLKGASYQVEKHNNTNLVLLCCSNW